MWHMTRVHLYYLTSRCLRHLVLDKQGNRRILGARDVRARNFSPAAPGDRAVPILSRLREELTGLDYRIARRKIIEKQADGVQRAEDRALSSKGKSLVL